MDSGASQFGPVEILLLLAAVPAMTFLVRRGFMRPGSLSAAPLRRTGLGLVELLGAIVVLLVAQLVAGLVLVHLGLAPPHLTPTDSITLTAPTTSPATRPPATTTPAATHPATAPAPPQPAEAWRFALMVVLIQAITQLPVVVLILAFTALRPGGWRELGVVPRRWREELRLGLFSIAAVIPLVIDVINITLFVGLLFHQPPPETAHELLSAMTRSTSPGATAVMIFSAVVIAPVLEETIFRGLIQTAFVSLMGPRARWVAVCFASLIFASVHVGSGVPWQSLPGLFFLALVLGWIYESTGSLFPAIVVHAGFNAFNTAVTLAAAGQ